MFRGVSVMTSCTLTDSSLQLKNTFYSTVLDINRDETDISHHGGQQGQEEFKTSTEITFKYHVFAPMERFQLE